MEIFASRWLLFKTIFAVGIVFGLGLSANSYGQNYSMEGQTYSSDLQTGVLTAEILGASLYAKTPSEKEYCDFVGATPNDGVLTNKILYGAYRYALKKEKDRRFICFRLALEKLCKDAKIDLGSPSVDIASASTKPTFSLKNFFSFGLPSKPKFVTK